MRRCLLLFLFCAAGVAIQAASTLQIEYMDVGTGYYEYENKFFIKGPSRSFTTDVEAIYVVIRLVVTSGAAVHSYNATVQWYGPQGLYLTQEVTELTRGSLGTRWSIARRLPVRGTEVEKLPGRWRVVFKVLGGPSKTVWFEIKYPTAVLPPGEPTAIPSPSTPTPPTAPPEAPGDWAALTLDNLRLGYTETLKVQYFKGGAWVSLALRRPGGKDWLLVEDVHVDTGATATMLPAKIAEKLGIDVRSGREIEFTGVVGEGKGWLHLVEVAVLVLASADPAFDGYALGREGEAFIITIPILFTYDSSDLLLGREGVLDYLRLTFEAKFLVISIR